MVHNWSKFNELYKSTYISAADKMQDYQPRRADKLRKHADNKGLPEITPLSEYKYDIYVDYYLTHDDNDRAFESFDIPLEGCEVREDSLSSNRYSSEYYIGFVNKKKPINEVCREFKLYWIIGISNNSLDIRSDLGMDIRFMNRRSALNFIKFLRKLYIHHNPNNISQVLGKINDTEVININPDDVLSESNFWAFLHKNGYDWNKFRSEFKINQLWDRYDD